MAFELFYLTQTGARYIAKANAGAQLAITRAEFGSGLLSVGLSEQTALLEPLGEMAITKKRVDGAVTILTTQFSNRTSEGKLLDPFYFSEIGLFGKISDDPDYPEALIAYGNAKTLEKADYIPATLTEFLINWTLSVSGNDSVTIALDESLVYVTKTELEDRLSSFHQEELDALLSAFTVESVERAFTSVFSYLGEPPPTDGATEMDSGDVSGAISKDYTGESSGDSTAMSATEITQALSSVWDGRSSDDPTALNADEISAALLQAEQ